MEDVESVAPEQITARVNHNGEASVALLLTRICDEAVCMCVPSTHTCDTQRGGRKRAKIKILRECMTHATMALHSIGLPAVMLVGWCWCWVEILAFHCLKGAQI